MDQGTHREQAPRTAPETPIVIHPPMTGNSADIEQWFGDASARTAEPVVVGAPWQPQPAPRAPEAPARVLSLDALRGAFLLAMTLAYTIPFGVYPDWMYHMQFPPPAGEFVARAGLTWRDLLFAGFLFTMSAAIPLTMTRRMERGMPGTAVLWTALRRAFLLFVFALIIGHVNPYWTQDYTKRGNVMAMLGFLVCFALFLRPRAEWPPALVRALRPPAWGAAAALLFIGPWWYGASFSLARKDEIMAALAFAAVAGTAIWLATRRNVLARLAITAVVLALMLATREGGWLQLVTPVPGLYQPWYLELLLIIIPGTIAGDLLVEWSRAATPPANAASHAQGSERGLLGLALAALALTPVLLVGLYTRYVPLTTGVVLGVALAGALPILRPRTATGALLQKLYCWAVFWIAFGLLLEPLDGGIKKVPQTLSYLTLTTGISLALLVALAVLVQQGRRWQQTLGALADIGQNPMLAYVAYMLFLNHLLWLVGVGGALTDSWWGALLRGVLATAAVAFGVWYLTRRRIYWRA